MPIQWPRGRSEGENFSGVFAGGALWRRVWLKGEVSREGRREEHESLTREESLRATGEFLARVVVQMKAITSRLYRIIR